MKRTGLNLLLILGISISVFAQNNTLNMQNITVGERIFEYEQITGDSSRTFGTIYERIKRDTASDLIEITFLQELPNATLTDTLLVNGQTFEPTRYRSVVPQFQDISVNYTIPGKTVIDMQRNIPNQRVDTTLRIETQSRVYDYHWPHVLLYTLESLETEDDVINLPVFTYRNQKRMQPISYKGIETVKLQGNSYEAIIWKAVDPGSGTENTYWIDGQTNRLLQSKAVMSNGVTFWFRRK